MSSWRHDIRRALDAAAAGQAIPENAALHILVE